MGGVIFLLIWAFVPYTVAADGRLEGFDFDTAQSKRELAEAFREFNLAWVWQPIMAANVEAVLEQVACEESIVLNLCDGIEERGTPGPCVVRALEAAGIRFTVRIRSSIGSRVEAGVEENVDQSGVPTPAFEELSESVSGVCARVGAHSGEARCVRGERGSFFAVEGEP